MNQKIAIPVTDGRLSSHFGHCQHFVLADIEDGKVVQVKEEVPPPHAPGVIPQWLGQMGVTDVLTGGVGQKAIDIFRQFNIRPVIGVASKTPDELIEDFLNQQIEIGDNQCSH
jgi:predicted Fe-Mo cluster-binding NifX family protein